MMLNYSKAYENKFLSKTEIECEAHDLSFVGIKYNLFQFNCNMFADAFLYMLTSHYLPSWVNRLELCLQRILCMQRLFRENEDIDAKKNHNGIVCQSAGNQTTIVQLLRIGTDNQQLITIYEVMLENHISCGIIPNFHRLHQSSEPRVQARLTYVEHDFLSAFPTKQSITLNKLFDGLTSLQQQIHRLERKYALIEEKHFC
ncbi:unnamed protein product [Adineta ricciae]|uniref:PPPDE domain-containing protein n=1 Tax=Adineta ricciae TaxID=249248 RepID=A0A814X9Q4_ADIRI|nr:unnamed protein product [Adineta ricciae]